MYVLNSLTQPNPKDWSVILLPDKSPFGRLLVISPFNYVVVWNNNKKIKECAIIVVGESSYPLPTHKAYLNTNGSIIVEWWWHTIFDLRESYLCIKYY
jgi:hypothetical protein